ncbi:protein of unknown function [Thauera humireducens]|nr:protein of unknown function [Thauera humireducens]
MADAVIALSVSRPSGWGAPECFYPTCL